MCGAKMNSKLSIFFVVISLTFACAEDSAVESSQTEIDFPVVSADVLFEGAPENSELGSESKADEVFPLSSSELLETQSPVKSQGSRGVCSIFSTVALMEHLYKSEGTITDPDFSEQYLQWSTKFELNRFRNSSGSNAMINLTAAQYFGVPVEEAWNYEEIEWDESNDPDCATVEGVQKPTRCYTNGTPPMEAFTAEKYRLPNGRPISARARDIKAHIHNRKQAVVLGLTFFYQSWNHRSSTLPVSAEYSKQGYILYPNDEDKALGLEKRAGHSILIVGWDDELEVQALDKEGNPAVDANGDPIVQKGFFLFKNSWGTEKFGSENEKGAGYGWLSMKYAEEFGRAAVADFPRLRDPIEICGDNIDNDNNGDTDCDDSLCSTDPTCLITSTEIEVRVEDGTIPDNDSDGISLSFEVQETMLSSMVLDVDIKHTFSGDLSIELITPNGDIIEVLKEGVLGGVDDIVKSFVIESAQMIATSGEWKLRVVDHSAVDTGVILSARVTTTP